ncbi:MAG: MBL fold metallo-hydrolase [Polyangiaceae bacterium]|nr:MBL fold metallo-hydrolase [Polyangiaceae bacterium]
MTDALHHPRPLLPGLPAVEIFPALTPTLPPATHTNSYALGAREVLLIEPATPYEAEREAWLAWAERLRAEGRTLVALVATHHHDDHVGGAAFLARALGLPLWAHALTAERIAAPVDRFLHDGETLRLEGPDAQGWQVLHTPGHAPGHVCLYEPSLGAIVAGDMIAGVGTILIMPGDGDMREYLRQLERLGALGAKVALPAHGDPIEEPAARFAAYVAHRLAREAKVVRALETGGAAGLPLDQLLPRAYDDVSPSAWPLAKLSLLAHLEKLVVEGRVSASGPGGGSHFTAAGAP